jgi:hypothetical protein
MSVYRDLPLPYVFIVSILYSYQQKGTNYKATGMIFIASKILHIVAGILIFLVISLSVLPVQGHFLIYTGVFASILTAFILHPGVFRWLLSLGNSQKEVSTLPEITWTKIFFLLFLNAIMIVCGGSMIFFAASTILDLSLFLLPVCIAAFGLALSIVSFLFWLPSDFGLFQLIMLLVFYPYLPVSYVLALLAMMRLSNIILDTLNLGIALGVGAIQSIKERSLV